MSDQNVGHNNPPADPYAPLRERVDVLVKAANVWLQKVPKITDGPTAKACDDFLNQIKTEISALDLDRKARNKPFETAVKSNNDAFRPLTALLEKAKDLLNPLKTGWLQREQARIAEESRIAEEAALKALQEAEDAKREAAKSIESAVAADEAQKRADEAMVTVQHAVSQKATVKGDYAVRSSGLRTYWSAIIEDYEKALAHYGPHPKVKELIQQLADADAREQKTVLSVPGCEPHSDQRAA